MRTDRRPTPLRAVVNRLAAALLSCVALIAASSAPADRYLENLERLKLRPLAAREALASALARFDQLPPETQAAINEFDDRINALDPETRASQLATLRAYHLWYRGLSEKDQQKIKDAPDDSARAEIIHKLRGKHEPPGLLLAGDLKIYFSDLGSVAPIELGNWMRVWLALSDVERKRVDGLAARQKQKLELARLGRQHQIPFKSMPVEEQEAILKKMEGLPVLKNAITQIKNRQAKNEEQGGLLKKKANAALGGRSVDNLVEAVYFAEHPPKPVASADLARFEAALPKWVSETLEPLPAADARRRLTILYREVYPHPEEMPKPKPAATKSEEPKKKTAPTASDKLTPF